MRRIFADRRAVSGHRSPGCGDYSPGRREPEPEQGPGDGIALSAESTDGVGSLSASAPIGGGPEGFAVEYDGSGKAV
jgi:hypothetical protein